MLDKSHAAAKRWLHAAHQAPVRPRHCTQALLQQRDQPIVSLYRALRRERCSVSVSGVCSAFRFCAPTLAVGVAGAAGADARELTRSAP
jgi:hypothetical protein